MSSRPPAAPMRPQSSPAVDSELWCAFLIHPQVGGGLVVVGWGFPPCTTTDPHADQPEIASNQRLSTGSPVSTVRHGCGMVLGT